MAVLKRNPLLLLTTLKKGLLFSVLAFVFLEVLLRLFGHNDYNVHREKPVEIHGLKSVVSDPLLGYRNGHPSPKTYRLYAQKLAPLLEEGN